MLRYLRLTRAHTVPLEAVPALLGAALAEGGMWKESVALWTIAGVLYHLAGYGHNSVEDWINGFDKDDPNKQHHPLNRGTISPIRAKYFVQILVIFTVMYVLWLAYPDPRAVGVLVLGLVTGLAYNIVGKLTKFKFILISAAHTSIFVIPYLAQGGRVNSLIFALGTFYMFIWIVFQISVSGEIKDFAQDESNFLKSLGSGVEAIPDQTVDTYIHISKYAKHYAYSLKILTIFTAFTIASALNSNIIILLILLVGSLILINLTTTMLESGYWDRTSRVAQMSLIEMMTASLFVASLWTVIGPIGAVMVIVSSIAWALLGNRILWGSLIGPRV